ncbi:MAG: metal ABC transporter substrate-binding protein [Nitrospiraceae bacterium]|nr:metal ABC transporter substrate-binding protein [Nitrospiraceae bacterium]
MKRLFQIIISILLLFYAYESNAENIKVIASIYPVGDIAKNVGRDKIDVKVMLPPGASPHTFDLTPLDMAELARAKVFVKIGAGLEFWAEKALKTASNKNLAIVDLSDNIPLIYGIDSHEHKEKNSSRSVDPHFWLDPVFAKGFVDKILEALIKADPQNKNFYSHNAETYKKRLDKLHEEIAQRTGRFRTKEYVSFHSTWNYFSNRYGLKVTGVIEEAPGREPSPKHIAKIIRELKKLHTRVVFAEPQFNPKAAEVIADESGAKILFLDPIGDRNIKNRDTYIGLLRYNLSVMEEAMK